MSDQQVPTTPKLSFLQDGDGSWSSKRLLSFLGYVTAAFLAVVAAPLVKFLLGYDMPLVALVGAFLGFSAAMQGVSFLAER